MLTMSKPWLIVSAVGQGVIFSLALTGAVRIAFWLVGTELSERAAGNLFLLSSLVAGSISGFLCVRYLKAKEASGGMPSGEQR
jgi:hypothetical protein